MELFSIKISIHCYNYYVKSDNTDKIREKDRKYYQNSVFLKYFK